MMGHHARASCTSPVRGPGDASAGYAHAGRVAERTKATVLKTVRGESLSRVRIPVLPRCDDQHQVYERALVLSRLRLAARWTSDRGERASRMASVPSLNVPIRDRCGIR